MEKGERKRGEREGRDRGEKERKSHFRIEIPRLTNLLLLYAYNKRHNEISKLDCNSGMELSWLIRRFRNRKEE